MPICISFYKDGLEMQKNNNDRIAWIDIARGIGIFLVVIGHCISPSYPSNYVIYCFHMPLFFILSGYGFNDKGTFALFTRKKAVSLLLPYIATLALAYIIWPINQSFPHHQFLGRPSTDSQVLYSILYGTGHPIPEYPSIMHIGPVWFLLTLFLANIIFLGISRLCGRRPIYVMAMIVLISAIIGKIIGSYLYMPWSLDIALVAQLFMLFGFVARRFNIFERIPGRLEIFVAALILAIDVSLGGLSMNNRFYGDLLITTSGAIVGSYLMIWLAQALVQYKYPNAIFSYLGQKAIIILCLHWFDFNKILFFLPTIVLYWIGKHGVILVLKRLLFPILFYNAFKYTIKWVSCINSNAVKPEK